MATGCCYAAKDRWKYPTLSGFPRTVGPPPSSASLLRNRFGFSTDAAAFIAGSWGGVGCAVADSGPLFRRGIRNGLNAQFASNVFPSLVHLTVSEKVAWRGAMMLSVPVIVSV
jgi:hypothetical protein